MKPLLYDYYANTLNPIYDKRNFDEIDGYAMPFAQFQKRNFDEIDAFAMPVFPQKRAHKRLQLHSADRFPSSAAAAARSPDFNEIDRSTYSDFMKRMYNEDRASSAVTASKRNFDEIDRYAMPRLILQNTLKRKNEAGNKVKKSVSDTNITSQ